MGYLITGGTGFIGRNMVDTLLHRKGDIFLLVRKESKEKFEALRSERWGSHKRRIKPVYGDLAKKNLGLSPATLKKLDGQVKHMLHLAAVYDLSASAEQQQVANIEGTRNAIRLAEKIDVGCFHHTSSIAAAGLYKGIFREDMFEEADNLDHPYFRTKHDSEGIVRHECEIPWRIYRPALVIGHSETGEIDKIDGPYYFFKLIQKMRRVLPPWMPTIGIEGGRINVVPVDYVVKAMDHIAHRRGLNGRCFHLVDPKPLRVGELLNLFARAGHAPQMTMRIDTRMFSFIPSYVRSGLSMLPPVRRITTQVLKDLGIPKDILKFVNYPTRFDSRETENALKKSGIRVPKLKKYAYRIWDYWERNLDPDLFIDRTLAGRVKDRVALVTGASSGIGKATALMLSKAGAKVIIVARGEEKLLGTKDEIEAQGGQAFIYTCDVADMESCDGLVEKVVADHGAVDFLINNAGRSIRRSIALSYDRFHDFERTMQLNYFGSLRLIMGFLPSMVEQHHGQVVNISSIGVLSNAPRFSAYVASKAALDAFSRCAASEFADTGINFTTINMPLVRTPMIAPTKLYDHVPTITPEEAADMVKDAIIRKPQRIATKLGVFSQVAGAISPKLWEILMNSAFRLFPDSNAAKGEKGRSGGESTSSEAIAFASLMRGIHW